IIPYCHERGDRIFAYEYNGYWKDVGTLGSYWESNMELIDLIPEFNLYEEFWKIYTKSDQIQPQYISANAVIDKAIIGESAEIYGEVHNSVIGAGVYIGEGAVIRDSIIMNGARIGDRSVINKGIIAEKVIIGNDCQIGVGEEAENKWKPDIYAFGLATIGEGSVIPGGIKIGKNTAISGVTEPADYPGGCLVSGESIIKAGDIK
ncbi:MAG: glucose-1-phosphate adenylyltransferase, partial [Acetivibrio ethanolgignens]